MAKTIGVIGLGSIGTRHAKNLIAMGHKVMAYDANKIDPNLPGLLWQPDGAFEKIEGVVIATPTDSHWKIMSNAIDFGHHIFVEKPIGIHGPYTQALLQDASRKNLIVMCGYNLRFHSCVKKAKEWLDDGLIGTPLWASFSCAQHNDKPTYLRDGVILNWSHEIDLALYLLGEVKMILSSTRLNSDYQDVMTDILFAHRDDTRTTIHLDYNTNPEYRGFNIVGTRGRIVSDLVRRFVWLHRRGQDTAFFPMKDTYDENYIEEMQAFIDRIDGKQTLGCTGEEALAVLDICLEVRKQAGLP